MKKNKFATVFNDFETVHITKDVGMIPIAFSKLTNFDKSTVYYWDRGCDKRDVHNNHPDELRLKPFHTSSRLWFYLKLLIDLKKEKIDIVNLYHESRQTVLLTALLKLLRFKVYIKLDLDQNGFEILKRKWKSNSIIYKIYKHLLCKADCISIESSTLYEKLSDFSLLSEKLIHVPNGLLPETVTKKPLQYEERKNKIVVVGRIGVYQKNHEIILDSLMNIESLKNWEIVFVGPIESNFIPKVDNLLKNRPDLASSVKLVGCKNREELFDIYAESKVFLMTSRWEGFSLALVEAAYMGCYIASTNVGGVEDVTDYGRLGSIFERGTTQEIQSFIEECTLDDTNLKNKYSDRVTYAMDKFNIEQYISKITDKLKNNE